MHRAAAYAIIAASLSASIAAAFIGYQFFGSIFVPEHSREFIVSQGESVTHISASLKERGAIRSDFWFRALVWLTRKQGALLAGTFELPERVSSRGMVQLLATAAQQDVATVTILEGWGIKDIAGYFEGKGMFQPGAFIGLSGAPGAFGSADNGFYNELAVRYRPLVYRTAAAPLEGYLFPDTYEVFADATAKDVVTKMVENFASKITPEMMEAVAREGKNFYNVLIMASIIEAEVPHEEDRAVVSDIFWSRLASGVALQSDATLNYILGGKNPALTLEQLEIDSAYNTYKYLGLPPTPIGNPGLSAIRAAIYPARTDYFYFLSTPEGETIFSRTLDEHNAAKAKHLR